MNNTNKILMMAVITSLLVIGTSLTPMQSFADRDKGDQEKTSDYKSKIFASSEEDKKSAKQHMDQDNECYRDDDRKQANQGQQVVGKDLFESSRNHMRTIKHLRIMVVEYT
jgi:hypothetical protein